MLSNVSRFVEEVIEVDQLTAYHQKVFCSLQFGIAIDKVSDFLSQLPLPIKQPAERPCGRLFSCSDGGRSSFS